MYKPPRKLLLASSIALALTTSSGMLFAAGTGMEDSDAWVGSRISTTYALSPHLRDNQIDVNVEDGVATLSGTVNEDIQRELAEQIALSVNGVEKVENTIEVKEDYGASPEKDEGERTFGELIDDATITAVVKSKLMWSRHAEGLDTSVMTRSGEVTLSGAASSDEAKTLAGALAASTRGVVAVQNKLEVTGGSGTVETVSDAAKDTAKDVGEFATDSWITTKVKSIFAWSSTVSSRDISVTTKDGVVELTGKVSSDVERTEAIDLVRALRGVKDVDASGLTL